MARIPGIRRILQWPTPSPRRIARDVDTELAFHLDARIEELARSGLSIAAAREQAEREFGDMGAAREELVQLDQRRVRRTRVLEWAQAMAFDLRYALRGLKTQPGLTLGIVLTLALGIGANATMFGVVDRLLLRPPAHVSDPGRLARVYFTTSNPTYGSFTGASASYPTYVALRDGTPSFQGLAAFGTTTMTSGRGEAAIQVKAKLVTGNFFRMLGARPVLGRFFLEDEASPPDGAQVVVLGYGFWQQRYGGDPGVIGRTVPLGKRRYTVIGIAPNGFTATDLAPVDVWLPVSVAGAEGIARQWDTQPYSYWLQFVARLRPGADAGQAAVEAGLVYQRLTDALRRGRRGRTAEPAPVTRGVLEPVSGARNTDGTLTAEARISRWLIGVSVIVLLIACANVANLLLARATRRRREIAVRLALGISRRRLIAQLMAEGVLLAMLGGLVGLAVAQWGGALMRGVLIPGVAWNGSPVDGRVLGATAAIVLVTAVLIGLAPALQASATELTSGLKAGARAGARRTGLRSTLIIAQAALSVLLLVGAGLFVRSLHNIQSVDVGMDTRHVLIATVDLESAGYTVADRMVLFRRAMERFRRLPGVGDASIGSAIPFGGGGAMSVIVPGRPDSMVQAKNGGVPFFNAVTPDFFATLGMRLVRGRGFTDGDREGAQRVAVIDETIAHTVWPAEDAIGKCIEMGSAKGCVTVIGVVQNAHRFRIREERRMQLYAPLEQGWGSANALFVRARGDPALLEGAVRRTLQSLAPNLPYADVHPLQDLLNPQIRPWTLGATMFGIFGLLALVVASIGLYSVLAYDVAQRVHEMGVRMALGARAPDVARLVLGDSLRVAAIGIVVGLVATLLAGRAIASLLFDTSPHDPAVLVIVCVTLLVVAVVASLVPAWRATRVDPSSALQAE